MKDAKGNAISGVELTVDLNGAKAYKTDKNGQIKVSTKGLAPKTYTAKITFNGNTKYGKSTKDVKVAVKKAQPKIAAKKKTFKAKKKVKVTIKIRKKTYKAKTNAKGKATFKIKKLTKKANLMLKLLLKATNTM